MPIETWVNAALAIGLFILGIADRRRSQAQDRIHKRIDDMGEDQKEHGDRLTALEEHLKHLPTAESIGRLHEKINNVGLDVAELKGGQKVMTDMLSKFIGQQDKGKTR